MRGKRTRQILHRALDRSRLGAVSYTHLKLLEKDGLVPKKIAIMSGSTIGEIKNILELFLLDEMCIRDRSYRSPLI